MSQGCLVGVTKSMVSPDQLPALVNRLKPVAHFAAVTAKTHKKLLCQHLSIKVVTQ